MSQKILKKLLAVGCVVSLLLTAPGMNVLADEIQEDEAIVTEVEETEPVVESVDRLPEEIIDKNAKCLSDEESLIVEYGSAEDRDISQTVDEELVGTGVIVVGDGVTATFDEETGAVEFYSDGGTLWSDWTDKAGIDRQEIVSIKVASGIVYLPVDSSGYCIKEHWEYYLFGGLNHLYDLDLSGFDTSNVTDMSGMFIECESLTNLDLSSLDTSKVTDMSYMFWGCDSLKNLDLSSLDTSNVTNMCGMFGGCRFLGKLDLSSLDTSNVTNMSVMFNGCDGLAELDLSNLDTSNVTDMSDMFGSGVGNCLIKLDLSNFDTSNVTDMSGMFHGCNFLTNLDISSFNTSNVTDMSHMFAGCDRLTNLDLSNFDTSNVTDMSWMFASNVIDDNWIHEEYSNLRNLDLSNFDTSNVTNMYAMFYYCICLTNLDLSNFDTSNVTNMSLMFSDCKSLTNLDLSSFDLSKVADYDNLFYDCKSLEILRTPKINKLSDIVLPITMYSSSGKKYTKLPVLGKSIVLGKTQKTAQNFLCFSDVQDPNHAFYKPIYWAADAGITKGYPDGTFGIDRSCTRGEMIMFLWRYAGKPAAKAVTKSPFSDVPKTHAFYNAILWGSQKGITKGYPDGTFGINRSVSRGECMMFLWRLRGKPAPKAVSVSPFKDVPKNHAFYNAILWGAQKKITNGYTSGPKKGTFGINENCTRGAIVTFLYRAR